MSTVGIICEYNPFHNGHAYQIREAKRVGGADTVVCVMSGNYVQRGEPAIVDKWTRAAWAIGEGADLVLELPTIWATAGARDFAQGAVSLLHEMAVDQISCGVEASDESDLQKIAQILNKESDFFRNTLQEELKKGSSYPRSREAATAAELERQGEDPNLVQLLRSPNNILAIEYMRAARQLNWKVPFVLIKRKGAEHNSQSESEGFLSASALRMILREDKEPEISEKTTFQSRESTLPVPDRVQKTLMEKKSRGELHPGAESLLNLLYSKVTLMNSEELKQIEGMGEGLENALIRACSRYQRWEEIVQELTSPRYAASRIRRILLNVCLGITQTEAKAWKDRIPYVKVLCFNEAGQTVMRSYRQQAAGMLLTNPGKERHLLGEQERELLDQEARWTDLYELTAQNPASYQSGHEYRRNAIKIAK